MNNVAFIKYLNSGPSLKETKNSVTKRNVTNLVNYWGYGEGEGSLPIPYVTGCDLNVLGRELGKPKYLGGDRATHTTIR